MRKSTGQYEKPLGQLQLAVAPTQADLWFAPLCCANGPTAKLKLPNLLAFVYVCAYTCMTVHLLKSFILKQSTKHEITLCCKLSSVNMLL